MQDFPEGAPAPQWRDNQLFGIILSKNYMKMKTKLDREGTLRERTPVPLPDRPLLLYQNVSLFVACLDIEIELQEEFCWSWHDMHVSRLLPTHNLFNLL